MSLARQFIRAAIEASTPALIRKASPFFSESDAPLRDFVLTHHATYGTLPSQQVLLEHGFPLPVVRGAPQPPEYHLNRLREASAYGIIVEGMPEVTDLLTARNVEGAIERLRGILSGAGTVVQSNSAELVGDVVDEVIADFETARQSMGALRGITLAYPTLNDLSLGAMPGDLIVVAGRPGSGKSYHLIELAYAAWQTSHRMVFLSMEMPKKQITSRFLGRHARINPHLIRSGMLDMFGRQRLLEGAEEIKSGSGRLYIESGDFSRKTSGLRNTIEEFGPEIVYVDAAYLLSAEGRGKGYVSRWESLAEVIAELKQMAIHYGIPIVISVQFNRNQKSKSREYEEPDLSDIAGTDSIPQDASLVIGLQKAPPPFDEIRRIATLMKNREGEVGRWMYNYVFDLLNFDEIPWTESSASDNDSDPAATQQNMAWME